MKKVIALALLAGSVLVNSNAAVEGDKVANIRGSVVQYMATNENELVGTVRARAQADNAHRKTTLRSATDRISLTV